MVNVGKCFIHAAYWNYIHLLISTSFTRPNEAFGVFSSGLDPTALKSDAAGMFFVETPQNQGL